MLIFASVSSADVDNCGQCDDRFINAEGNETLTGNLTIEGNITGTYYFGSGLHLTGLTGQDPWNTSPQTVNLTTSGNITAGGLNVTDWLNATCDINTTGDVTATHFYGDASGMTGISALGNGWTNTSTHTTTKLNASCAGNFTVEGNLSVDGGIIFKGAVNESVMGYSNVRLGVYAGTPRVTFETGGTLWEIDNGGGGLRFINGLTYEAIMRVLNKSVQVGDAYNAYNLTVYGNTTSTNYFSGDGSQGMTGSCASDTELVIKDGLVISCE